VPRKVTPGSFRSDVNHKVHNLREQSDKSAVSPVRNRGLELTRESKDSALEAPLDSLPKGPEPPNVALAPIDFAWPVIPAPLSIPSGDFP